MDLVLVGPEHREALAAMTGSSEEERLTAAVALRTERGRRLTMRVAPGCPLHVDDDPWPAETELEVIAGHAFVDVLVPPL
jgi:hypothetical protein